LTAAIEPAYDGNIIGQQNEKPGIDGESRDDNSRCSRGRLMPITQFLNGAKLDPETLRVVGVAFEIARVALRLAGRGDVAIEMVARRIIELARAGQRNPDLLCELVLKEVFAAPPTAHQSSALVPSPNGLIPSRGEYFLTVAQASVAMVMLPPAR